ncbi:hypothetical protein SLS62_006273 [Diatrype stigma]|uniref:Uncharacterized protein n=1 Tax=Diatrype stigma TaxID=117547 RepID=A0AAN9YRF3_9PEZI
MLINMHIKYPFSSTRFSDTLSLSLLFLFCFSSLFISTARAQAEPPPRPLPPGHPPDHTGSYFQPKPEPPIYHPVEHPAPLFLPELLDITAPLVRTLAHYDRFVAHYAGMTRIERVAGVDRLIRHLPEKKHEDPPPPRHVATLGQPRPEDYNGTDPDLRPGPLVPDRTVTDQITARGAKREIPYINYWDHPWEGHMCYTRHCKTDWDCTRQKCSTCLWFRCV